MPMWTMFGSGPATDTTPLLSDVGSAASDNDPGIHYSPDSSAIAGLRRASSNGGRPPAWSDPLGRPARDDSDEHLFMFRRAVGINNNKNDNNNNNRHEGGDAGQPDDQHQQDTLGIYRSTIEQERRKRIMHHTLSGMVWACHGAQIVLGATMTCLGLSPNEYPVTITVLGAVNTVTAGFLALVKGKGITEKLGQTEADFRQLKVWIEETEALLALGVIGGDRKEVGLLIETAFRKYNACFGRSFDIEAGIDRDADNLSVMEADRSRRENTPSAE